MAGIVEFLASLKSVLTIPHRYFVGLALLSGSLLALPESFLKALHLDPFVSNWGEYIGIVFAVSLAVAGVNFFSRLNRDMLERQAKKRDAERVRERVKNLDPAEVAVLREFYLQGQRVIEAPIVNPVIAGLIQDGIITTVGTRYRQRVGGPLGPVCSVTMTELGSKYIRPPMLGLKREYTSDEAKQIEKDRPGWIGWV